MNCELELISDGKYKCKLCNRIFPTKGKINCVANKKAPGLIRKAANFSKATMKHMVGGFKHCSEKEKEERYNICSSNKCGLFRKFGEDNGICAHDSCGCFIRSQGKFLDKLSWAESECPEGLWGPVEPESPENPENGV